MTEKTNKKNSQETLEESTPQLPNELFQLRDILFGEDKREFEAHFQQLEQKTNQQIEHLNAVLSRELNELRDSMDKGFSLLSDRLSDSDHLHSEREEEIKDFADTTANKLQSFEHQTQQVTDNIISKINKDTNSLNEQFSQKFEQTLSQLEQVSAKLQSNKADRKLLADLLTSAAQELNNIKD